MSDNLSSAVSEPAAAKRKAYTSPRVVEYGTLRDVTLSVGRNGTSDGPAGQGNNNKTQT